MASNGVYGTNVPSFITEDDVEIFYSYRPSRNDDEENSQVFTQLSSNILVQSLCDNDDGERYDNILEGLYNLKLPVEYFNKKGIYTIYIKPKEYSAVIEDVSVLSSYPDVRGIVIDSEALEDDTFKSLLETNNSLVGYRVIYFDNGERQATYRLVTSNNKCEPVIQTVSQGNQKFIRYRYNDSSSLVFLTLTPSTAPSFKPNATPFIGNVAQKVVLVNTKFEPIMLEIEMVDHDDDTISTMLEGSQLRDLDKGIITTYNEDNEIYSQHEFYSLKNTYTSTPIYEVKKQKTNSIDFNQTIEDK